MDCSFYLEESEGLVMQLWHAYLSNSVADVYNPNIYVYSLNLLNYLKKREREKPYWQSPSFDRRQPNSGSCVLGVVTQPKARLGNVSWRRRSQGHDCCVSICNKPIPAVFFVFLRDDGVQLCINPLPSTSKSKAGKESFPVDKEILIEELGVGLRII